MRGDLAPIARRLAEEGRDALVARVISFSGVGGRRAGETLILSDDGQAHGSLLGDLGERALADSPLSPGAGALLLELVLEEGEARRAGLACGGTARVAVSELGAMPKEVWGALERGQAVALVSRIGQGGTLAVLDQPSERSRLVLGSLGDERLDETALGEATKGLRAGRESALLITEGPLAPAFFEVLVPSTTLHILGTGELVTALGAQARLLGWSVAAYEAYDSQMELSLQSLGPADALVVLLHDHDEATPALAAGLRAGCYVGALGSRHTQAGRRRRLAGEGLSEEELARLHGPVGLDLGARTPEETALCIAAEILSFRTGRPATSLSRSRGPING